jgi:hypothetical protein
MYYLWMEMWFSNPGRGGGPPGISGVRIGFGPWIFSLYVLFLDGKVVLTLGGEEVLLEYLENGGGAAHQLLVALPHPVSQAARPVLLIKNLPTEYARRVSEIRRRALSSI